MHYRFSVNGKRSVQSILLEHIAGVCLASPEREFRNGNNCHLPNVIISEISNHDRRVLDSREIL